MLARCSLALPLLIGLAVPARAQSPRDDAATAAFVNRLQNADGGFGPTPGAASTLGATNNAIKVLKYTGGALENVHGALAFVRSCFDPKAGGFGPTPGAAPDVATTAVGLMAMTELKAPTADVVPAALGYFHEKAKTFEEIRIAVAGLEAVATPSPDFPAWKEVVTKDRKPDGTWGEGAGAARATGGAAVALLRMGATLDHMDAILKVLRDGQTPEGGWGDGTKPADLASSYRIMRGFFMMKEAPDLDRLLGFLARHRNEDGGYGPAPEAPSDASATYYAMIMIHWARLLQGRPAHVETAGFTPLFDGKTLDGWEGDASLWRAQDGAIVGRSPGLKHNDFLATRATFDDFVLRLTFRMRGDATANSGIMFRAVRVPPHEMSGYQADIGQDYWGCLYDESRRNRVLVPASSRAVESIREDAWNTYEVRAIGDQVNLTLNGVPSVSYREADPGIAHEGSLAVQLHAGTPLTVEFADLLLQRIPRPTADGDASRPGWHVRTLQTPAGPRKFTVYVPKTHDGVTPVPAVLFLHGSGERGDDGIRPAQAGLGPAVLAAGDEFPAIAIFPQARETWAAGSADADAALAALDDVMKAYKVDPERVALTGLSMGGRGAWEMAAAHPDRFRCVLPICGPAKPDLAASLAKLPVWSIVGDADRETTVLGMRALAAAIAGVPGAQIRHTEYRGLPHNSWDRAYGDPAVRAWLTAGASR
jgi:dienelactone hydrolase/prenyltransferase beta subunit